MIVLMLYYRMVLDTDVTRRYATELTAYDSTIAVKTLVGLANQSQLMESSTDYHAMHDDVYGQGGSSADTSSAAIDAVLQHHMLLLSNWSTPSGPSRSDSGDQSDDCVSASSARSTYTPDVTMSFLMELAGSDQWDAVRGLMQQYLHSQHHQYSTQLLMEGLAQSDGPGSTPAGGGSTNTVNPTLSFPQQLYERAIKISLFTSRGNGGIGADIIAYQLEELRHRHWSSRDTARGDLLDGMLFPTFRSMRYVLRGLEAECDWKGILHFFSTIRAGASISMHEIESPEESLADTGSSIQNSKQRATTHVSIYTQYSPAEVEFLYVCAIRACAQLEGGSAKKPQQLLKKDPHQMFADISGDSSAAALSINDSGDGEEEEEEDESSYYPLAIEYLSDYLSYYNDRYDTVISAFNEIHSGEAQAQVHASHQYHHHHQHHLSFTNGKAVYEGVIDVLVKNRQVSCIFDSFCTHRTLIVLYFK